jgi:hypothetical protein
MNPLVVFFPFYISCFLSLICIIGVELANQGLKSIIVELESLFSWFLYELLGSSAIYWYFCIEFDRFILLYYAIAIMIESF